MLYFLEIDWKKRSIIYYCLEQQPTTYYFRYKEMIDCIDHNKRLYSNVFEIASDGLLKYLIIVEHVLLMIKYEQHIDVHFRNNYALRLNSENWSKFSTVGYKSLTVGNVNLLLNSASYTQVVVESNNIYFINKYTDTQLVLPETFDCGLWLKENGIDYRIRDL